MQDALKTVSENWRRVQEDVAAATADSAHHQKVTIVGVSKYVDAELTSKLVEAGCSQLGENRPQVLWEKSAWFEDQGLSQPAWHMIGHLQRNKVRRTLPLLHSIHSVDSLRLATTIDTEAKKIDRRIPILAEVNVTADESKTGMPPEELASFLEQVAELKNLELQGMMAMSTHFAGGDQARREFAQVRELRDSMQSQFPNLSLAELSMGMSGDFREAISEGATLVRIGSSIWEGLRD